MRRFIYLDTEVLKSYLAQIDDGLLESHEIESQVSDSINKQTQHTISPEIDASFKLFGKGIEGKIEYIFDKMKSIEQSEIFKDIRTKKLHDNAFDRFISHLETNYQLSDSMCQVGSFVKFAGQLSFIDFDYLSSQFDKNGLIEFLKNSQANEIEDNANEQLETLSREQKRSKESEIKKAVKQLVAENNAQYDNALTVINLLKLLIPYKKIVASGNYLIATSERFFRDDPEIVAFKYGGNLSIAGYITNVIYGDGDDKAYDEAEITPLASIQPMINKMITSLFNSKKTMYIVHPIAIYYE